MGLAAVATLGTAEAAEMATVATGGGCVLAGAVLIGAISTVKRSTDAVSGIIEVSAEASMGIINVTKEAAETVIEEIGKEGKRLVPIAFGIAVVVILVSLNVFVTYFWKKKPKVEMLKAGKNPSSNDMSSVVASSAPYRVDKIFGMPLLRCSTKNTLREHVANFDDAIRMCQQEIANPGHWVRPCDTFHSKVFFVYEVYSQNMKSHDPNHKQFWLVRLHKASCESSDPNINWRIVLNCNCGGYHQLGLQDIKRLCKHCGLVILLCRLGWHQQLVSCGDANRLGPIDRATSLRTSAKQQASLMKAEARTIADRITELENQTSVLSRNSIPAQIQRLEDTFVEINQNVRSARMNEPLVVTLAPGNELRPLEKDEASPDAQQQGFGTSLEPYDSRAERPKSVRSRGSNKILEKLEAPRDDVVDEAALKAMFEGYDKTADNAADINLEGSGRVIAEMGSKQTLKFAIRMIDKASHEVVLTAYTFDVAAVVEALSKAASRGVQVKVYVDRDHALRGTTMNMPARLSELVDAGVEVRLCRGAKGGSGIQHSKTLQCDQILIIGSTNWTNSSQSNQEVSVAYCMNAEGLRAHTKRIEEMRESSEVFSEAAAREAIENRAERRTAGNAIARSRSMPAEDKYRTARKFSIANGIRMEHASTTK